MTARRRWPVILALLIGLALVGVFGVRAWHQWQYTQRVARGEIQVETLRGWMTLSYISRVYGVPEGELRGALGVPAQGHDDRSLRDWFVSEGIDPLTGRQRIEALIVARAPGKAAR